MPLSQFIRDNTNDGTDIASVLIDVMNGHIDGSKVGHRLSAAKLLIIYGNGNEDADDFIADNTPDVSDQEWGERVRVSIDPVIASHIKLRSDGGRDICLFLIDVVMGRVEGINVGHRVAAAKHLLDRARMEEVRADRCPSLPAQQRHAGRLTRHTRGLPMLRPRLSPRPQLRARRSWMNLSRDRSPAPAASNPSTSATIRSI